MKFFQSFALIATLNLLCPVSIIGQEKETINVEQEDLEHRQDDLFYIKGSKTPVTGNVITNWYGNSELKYSEGNYVDGKREGLHTMWDTDGIGEEMRMGQKTNETYYVNNKKEGLEVSWSSYTTQKTYEGAYRNGMKEGLHVAWDSDGQKKYEGAFVSGEKEGFHAEWMSGKNRAKGNWVNGKEDGLHTTWAFYPYKKTESHYSQGKKNGKSTLWDAEENKVREENYVEDQLDGLLTEYHTNGQKSYEENYVKDKRDGPWTNWDETGTVISKGFYQNDKPSEIPTSKPEDVPSHEIYLFIDNIYYHKGSKIRFTGWSGSNYFLNGKQEGEGLPSRYENGQKLSSSNHVNGKKHGVFMTWYENGQKMDSTNYVNGKQDGISISWYENGQKSHSFNTINGMYDGKEMSWNENGQKKEKVEYVKGYKEGIHLIWVDGLKVRKSIYSNKGENIIIRALNTSGQKISEYKVVNGKREGNETSWHPNGKKKRETVYVFGTEIGPRKSWYTNGQQKSEGQIDNNGRDSDMKYWDIFGNEAIYGMDIESTGSHGSTKFRKRGESNYFNGIISIIPVSTSGKAVVERGNFANGQKISQWLSWYENGQKASDEYYNGYFRHGSWTLWHPNGQKSAEEEYITGNKVGTWYQWHANGVKKSEGNYYVSEREGLWTEWHDNGQKQSERNYNKGSSEGLIKEWYANGKKKEEGNYLSGHRDGLLSKWYDTGLLESETLYSVEEEQKTLTNTGVYINKKEWTWFENGQMKSEAFFERFDRYCVKLSIWNESGQKLGDFGLDNAPAPEIRLLDGYDNPINPETGISIEHIEYITLRPVQSKIYDKYYFGWNYTLSKGQVRLIRNESIVTSKDLMGIDGAYNSNKWDFGYEFNYQLADLAKKGDSLVIEINEIILVTKKGESKVMIDFESKSFTIAIK